MSVVSLNRLIYFTCGFIMGNWLSDILFLALYLLILYLDLGVSKMNSRIIQVRNTISNIHLSLLKCIFNLIPRDHTVEK